MPVKKTIRRKKPSRVSKSAWTMRPARALRATRAAAIAFRTQAVKRFTRVTASISKASIGRGSMDKGTVAAVLTTAAMVVALVYAGYRTMPAGTATEPSIVAAAHEDTRLQAAPTAPAVADTRTIESAAPAPVSTPEMVTIAGCLAQDGDTFRLKDTTGADAPRTRSWKSGFLKKSAAAVEVVDASRRLKLTNHVGERISVTGTLVDGEMQVRSMRRVSSSCSENKPKVNA
jgi:hypothetical protein